MLEELPEDTGADATRLLCDLYVRTGKGTKAVDVARKAFARNRENYSPVFEVAQTLIEGGEAESGLKLVSEIREAMMAADDFDRLNRVLSMASCSQRRWA